MSGLPAKNASRLASTQSCIATCDSSVWPPRCGDSTTFGNAVSASGAGPFSVDVELRYQSIGYRWAHNLDGYDAAEPKRFVDYFNSMAADSSVLVARTSTTGALAPR